jgi:flagellar hook protein FlgE
MGLFGALFAGVSGLDSQSNKIGIISNNISNVNTVGYKQGQAAFDTLVVPSGTTSFSPGGVIGNNQQLVNQQGVISATTSPTDIAISGGGLLFVSTSAAGGANNQLFTRAGSFTQDANGNFINSANYFLQGVPIDPTTGNPEAFSKLATVNVSSSATGKPTQTSTIALGANFNASQTPLLGSGETISSLAGQFNGIVTANQIIAGNDVNGENSSLITRGDSFSINDSATTNPVTFTYGGFAIGRNITINANDPASGQLPETTANNAGGLGDGANILNTQTNVTNTNIASTGGSVITVTLPNADAQGFSATAPNNFISLNGVSAIGTIPAADINGQHVIASVTPGVANTVITFDASNGATDAGGNNSTTNFTVSDRTLATFTGNILNAQSPTDDFLNGIVAANTFTSTALDFSISVNGNTTKFAYSANPNPSAGTFNSLNTLVSAIDQATGSGLTAQITGWAALYQRDEPQ